ncbi:hypothetical protein SARC_09921 [Sphaeroforma arctica JP610]|uniref:dAMP1 SANT/Myb-like domain-containing protein n=1 Tax=Sphaeroforma arctica JP610 TaxID=667725 RepID=A0A0L0FNR9_9EUKA|nr:hypothetical protein SARC_09921 [Sphaeroforma arctica JP610]KNC77623.1 hypothetical protein SARC_09921 [Sphaeroforma arctica JP610]|eukprot:XP_014151525.1 hypothetical protein SARC_09921 [Sphaeroforma arctica JP610]
MVKAVSTAGGASRVSPVKTTQRTTATNSSAINKVPTSGTLSTHESAKAAHESVAKTSTGSTATIAATASTVIKIPTASVPGSGPTKVKAHMERGAGTGADVSTSIKDTKHPQDMLTPTKGLASNTKASPGTTAVGRNTSKSTGGTSESTVSGVTTTGGTSTHSEAPANGHKSGASVGVTGGVPSIRTHYSSKSNSASRKNRDKDKHKDGKSKGDKHSSSGRKDKDKSRDKDKDGEEAPVVVPTPKPILYADDFADIQQGGLLQHENDLVMLVPTIPAMRVLRQRKAVPARKWIQAPIINHGRKDALKLSHWVPESLRENEHAFAPLGDMVMTDVPVYTDEEYTTHIQPRSGDWTRAETDELLELCRRFDRRFIIVHDRYMGGTGLTSPPVERTIEALKERYYL